ncbi:hypothetical protein Tco_0888606 [Tanacetum coccineum]
MNLRDSGSIESAKVKLAQIDINIDNGNVSDDILLERMELSRIINDFKHLEATDRIQKAKLKFGQYWGKRIQRYLASSMASRVCNGTTSSDSPLFRGLKQGIQISESTVLSHLFYADDAIFMGEWSEPNMDGGRLHDPLFLPFLSSNLREVECVEVLKIQFFVALQDSYSKLFHSKRFAVRDGVNVKQVMMLCEFLTTVIYLLQDNGIVTFQETEISSKGGRLALVKIMAFPLQICPPN